MCMCICKRTRMRGPNTHISIHTHTYSLVMDMSWCLDVIAQDNGYPILYTAWNTHTYTHVRPRTHMRTHQHVEHVTFHMLHISNTLKWRKKWWNAIPTTFVYWSYKKERKTTKRTEPTKRTGCVCVRLPFCTTERPNVRPSICPSEHTLNE